MKYKQVIEEKSINLDALYQQYKQKEKYVQLPLDVALGIYGEYFCRNVIDKIKFVNNI